MDLLFLTQVTLLVFGTKQLVSKQIRRSSSSNPSGMRRYRGQQHGEPKRLECEQECSPPCVYK